MNFPLRNIIILVLLALAGIFLWQVYWLHGLYKSERTSLEKTIKDVMTYCDFAETEMRFKHIKTDGKFNGSIRVNTYKELDNLNKRGTVNSQVIKERESKQGTVADTALVKESDSKDSTLTILVHLVEIARRQLHAQMDKIARIDLQVYDSLLTARLDSAGINVRHQLSLCIDGRTAAKRGSAGFRPDGGSERFVLELYSEGADRITQYVLLTEPLTRTLLIQMAGILTASLLIFIIIGFVLWYLVYTLVRIRNLDEMKTDFSNNITHELKTPIAVALAANDALLNYGMDDNRQKRREYLGVCRGQLHRLSGMVEQILSMSMERRRNMVLNITDVSLKDTVSSLTHEHTLKAEKPVAFTVSIQPEDLTVRADSMHLRNIISNLIDNAVKYSNAEVSITINAAKTAGGVDIEVADNGIGIAKDKLRYVFDRFFRVADGNRYTVKGYGLGLYYVKTMTEKLGGTVSVSSVLGKGTTFKLHFNE